MSELEGMWHTPPSVEERASKNAQIEGLLDLLDEAVPHIKRASIPYKDGWIEEKESILSRIAVVLGAAP